MMGFVGVFVLNELRSLSSDTGYVTAARRDQAGCELEPVLRAAGRPVQ
jgi:hypothetical protein